MMPHVLSDALLLSHETAYRWISHLTLAMEHFEIDRPRRKAAFLVFAARESNNFTQTVVSLRGMTARRIQAYWPDIFPTVDSAQMWRGEEQLANRVFACKAGNGTYESGDGFRFRPRGLLPICGRAYYELASFGLEFDFIDQPHRLAEDHYAALSAGWYWQEEGFNQLADQGDVDAIAAVLAQRHLTDGRPPPDIKVRFCEALQVLQ